MRLVNWIMAGCFFTASFDLLLIFNVGGTLRFSQAMLALICVAAAARILQDGRILWPRGGTAITLWILSQALFLPISGIFTIALQFFLLALFTIVAFFAVLQLYGRGVMLTTLFRIYLWSFVFVAAFGLIQFVLPLLHLPSPLVVQWYLQHRIARINGFSYEPSYFATYLMMGWIMLVELRINNAQITAGRKWKWITVLLTVVMIICTSKTGWLVMLVEMGVRLLVPAWQGFRNTLRRIREGLVLIRIPRQSVILNIFLIVVIAVGSSWFIATHIDPWTFLQGTGIGNTAAHSYDARSGTALATWETFLEHPFVGRTLGGVPVAIAEHTGRTVNTFTFDDVHAYFGFPVILDVLTASGIFGFIPFVWFFWVNTIGAMRLSKRYWPTQEARWLRALARGLIFECLMLLADQNILRVYVWLQLTMVTVVAYYLEFGRNPEPVAEEGATFSLPLAGEATA